VFIQGSTRYDEKFEIIRARTRTGIIKGFVSATRIVDGVFLGRAPFRGFCRDGNFELNSFANSIRERIEAGNLAVPGQYKGTVSEDGKSITGRWTSPGIVAGSFTCNLVVPPAQLPVANPVAPLAAWGAPATAVATAAAAASPRVTPVVPVVVTSAMNAVMNQQPAAAAAPAQLEQKAEPVAASAPAAAAAAAAPAAPSRPTAYPVQMKMLSNMGFDDQERNEFLLSTNRGDIQRVCNILLSGGM